MSLSNIIDTAKQLDNESSYKFDFSVDSIQIKKIRANGKHGVHDAERKRSQPFDIDLELNIDLSKAQISDDLTDTVDYSALHNQIVKIVETHSYQLLERLAGAVLESIFTDKKILAARIRIAKPEKLNNGATPAVVLTRRNSAHVHS